MIVKLSGNNFNKSYEIGEKYLETLKEIKKLKNYMSQQMKELIRNIVCKILNRELREIGL